jgi:uncharacterized coiled-coil protein SlyX
MPDAHADRLRELEIKISFWENHVAQQDRAMMEMGRQLDRLERQLKRLADSVKSGEPSSPPNSPAADERPPHY